MTVEITEEELVAAGLKSPSGAAACPALAGAQPPDAHTLPIIGIVPTYKVGEGTLEMPDRYVKAIAAAGGAPVVLPFNRDVSIYETLLPNIDGFLLSGGQDIDPVRYGQEITYGKAEEISPGREEVEYLIISFARQYDIPLLGICRGMQMINVSFGGTLYQDLTEESKRKGHWQTEDYALPTHKVNIERNTKLGRILGVEEAFTNSMHHQGIRDVGEGLRIAAYGEDGLVEAVESPEHSFLMGVQWHPEFFAGHCAELAGATCMAPLFEKLISEADNLRRRSERCRSCTHILREECGGCFPDIKFAE